MPAHDPGTLVLGAGVTGLAVGLASGAPIYEARAAPGGICSSYYLAPGWDRPRCTPPADGRAYRFELGGGHWIFGGEPSALRLIEEKAPCRAYERRAGVYFAERDHLVPYPLQGHLDALGPLLAQRIRTELAGVATAVETVTGASATTPRTMEDWLAARFGKTLLELFFAPFHERYTAGLWRRIAPQDAYKTATTGRLRSAAGSVQTPVGYNATFRYPRAGLDGLARALADDCRVHYDHLVTAIDLEHHRLRFASGDELPWRRLVSTLPLSSMQRLCDLDLDEPPDPHTSVLVLNIGGRRGSRLPDHHWLYVPDARSGFFRVGVYSNVEPDFLPAAADGIRAGSDRVRSDRVSFYVESAYPGGQRPEEAALARIRTDTIDELHRWGFLEEPEVVDATWIEVAYTWSWPGSRWRERLLARLASAGVTMVGRYGRWVFQGIADSIRDGLEVGATLAGARDAEVGGTAEPR